MKQYTFEFRSVPFKSMKQYTFKSRSYHLKVWKKCEDDNVVLCCEPKDKSLAEEMDFRIKQNVNKR